MAFRNIQHPYIKALISAIPVIDLSQQKRERTILQGDISTTLEEYKECRFAFRCSDCQVICKNQLPKLYEREPVSAQVIFKTLRVDRACKSSVAGRGCRSRQAAYSRVWGRHSPTRFRWDRMSEMRNLAPRYNLALCCSKPPFTLQRIFFQQKAGCVFVNIL